MTDQAFLRQMQQSDDLDGFATVKPGKNYFTEQKQDKTCKRKLRPSMTAAQIQQRQNEGPYGDQKRHSGPFGGSGIISSNEHRVETVPTNYVSGTSNINQLSPRDPGSIYAGNDSEARQSDRVIRKQYLRPKVSGGFNFNGSQEPVSHYDDNIDSETEVFYQAEEEAQQVASMKNGKRNQSEKFRSHDKPRRLKPDEFLFQQLNNHHQEIDLVLQSNFDEQTKQKMISEIQNKFRLAREQLRKQQNDLSGQQRIGRTQYREQDPLKGIKDGQRRTKYLMDQRGFNAGTRPDSPTDNQKTTFFSGTNNDQPVMNRRNRQKHRQQNESGYPEIVDQQNQQYLMPEVTELRDRPKAIHQDFAVIDKRTSTKKKSPRAIKQKKKSKSPSPPKTYNEPHLYTKRTFGNKYCGYCIAHDATVERSPRRSSDSNDKRHNSSMHMQSTSKMRRRRHELHDHEHDDPKQKRNQPFTPGRIRASQKLNNSIEPDDRDAPYGSNKPSHKYDSIRDSTEIKKGRIPAIQGRHQNGQNMDVDPSVNIFEKQRKSQDPVDQHYRTAQFQREPALKDSVDWDLDGRKRNQKILVSKIKPSNQRLPQIPRDHQNSALTTQTEQPSVSDTHQPIPKDERSHKAMPQKRTKHMSSDESLTYEDYLAKQQRKFKKLYGKKLIVEDDYLNEEEFNARQEKRNKSKGSVEVSAEPQKRHSASGHSIGKPRASQDIAANTLFTLGNNSRSRKFIDMGRRSSQTRSIVQNSSGPVNGQISIHDEKHKNEPSLTNQTQQDAKQKDKALSHAGYPTNQIPLDARSKADAQSHLGALSHQTRQDARSKDNAQSYAGVLSQQNKDTRSKNAQSHTGVHSHYTQQDAKSKDKVQSHAGYPSPQHQEETRSKDNAQSHAGVLSQVSNQISHQSRYSRMTVPQAVQSQTLSTGLKNAKQNSKAAFSNQPASQKNNSSRNQSMHISQQINTQRAQNFEVDDKSISKVDPSRKSRANDSSKRSAEELKLSKSLIKTSTSQPPFTRLSNNGMASHRSQNNGMGSHRSQKSGKAISLEKKQQRSSRNTFNEQIQSHESRNQTGLLFSQLNTENMRLQPHLDTDDFAANRTNPNTNRTHLKAQEVSLGGQSIHMITQDKNASIQDHRMLTPGVQTVFSQPTETQMAIISGHQPKSTGKRLIQDEETISNPVEANLDVSQGNRTYDNVTASQVRFHTNMFSDRKQLHNYPTPRTNMALNQNFKINSHTAFEVKKSEGAQERPIGSKIDITSSNSAGLKMASHSPSSTQGYRNLNNMKLGQTHQQMTQIQSDSVMIPNSIQKRYSTSQPGARSLMQNRAQRMSINKAISSNSIGKHSKGKNARVRNIEHKSAEKDVFGHRNSHPQHRESVSKSRSASKRGSQNYVSRSPQRFNEKAKLMEDLTGGKVKVSDQTKLLINGSEILSQAGISGKINQVGVGFGTGRHTQSRKSNVGRRELVMQSQKSQMLAKQAQTMFMLPGIFPPDVVSVGCEAYRGPQKSEMLSARNPDVGNFGHSPRTQTIKSLKSVGLSAKQSTVRSRRDQMDQVSNDRFNPLTNEEPTQTSYLLLQDYMKRPQQNQETSTEPVNIIDEEVFRTSIMIQTIPIIEERDVDEPQPLFVPDEPLHRGCGLDEAFQTSRSLTSQLSTPLDEKPYEFKEQLPPPQDPDEQITDDWAKSGLFVVVQEQQYDCLIRKGMIDPEQVPRPEHANDNKLASLEEKLLQNLNPDGRSILSLIDCDYGQALLRKKKHTQDFEKIQELYAAAKTTIEKLTENMIKPDISLHIFFKYYQEINRKNVIKLLLRCKRLYDARNQMVHILVHVMQIEEVLVPKNILWRILQDNTPVKRKNHMLLIKRTLRFLSTALTKISTFQQEHRLFAGEFKFNRDDYIEFIVQIGQIIGGFMIRKKEANPALQPNGLILEDHDEEDTQKMAYKEWVTRSEREFGRMDLPSEEQTERWLPEETVSKDFNDSRVAKALKAMTNFEQAQLKRAEKMQAQAIEHPEYQPLESEKMEVAGKTLISEQAIDRAQWSQQKRKIIQQQNLNRQPSEEIDYEREEEKLKSKKFPGLHLLKQKLKYDNDLDGETVNNLKSDLISKEQQSVELRMGMQAYPSQSEITYVQHDKSIMQSEDVNIQSQEDFALESPKIKLQFNVNLARQVGTANFNDGKSEADMHRGRPPSLFQRENSDLGQDLTKELITLPLNEDKQLKIKVIPPKFKPPQAEILKKSLVRHQDVVSENTDFQPINKKYAPIQTKDVDVISEASEFTYQQEASQRILLETKHCKEEDTEQGEREQSQGDYINVMSDFEDNQARSDFSRGSSMQQTGMLSKGKATVNQSVKLENTKIKLRKTPIAGSSSGNKAVTRK